jgi:uncharacterized protein (TIGR03067 family)
MSPRFSPSHAARWAWLGVSCLLAAGCSSSPPEFKRFEGSWKLLSLEMEGKPALDENSRHQNWTFTANTVVIAVTGFKHNGVYELRGGESPKQIDILPGADNSNDQPLYGIYEFNDQNALKVCLSASQRPTELSTRAGQDWVLGRLVRADGLTNPELLPIDRAKNETQAPKADLTLPVPVPKALGPSSLGLRATALPPAGSDGARLTFGQLFPSDARDPLRSSLCKVYTAYLEAHRTYTIDLKSTSFDAFLRVEDSGGNQLAEDDDSGGDLDARIAFSPPRSDTYRIIAASRGGHGVGAFSLQVR